MINQKFLRILMDVPRQQTIAMDPAARLHPRKHRQCPLSHYRLPRLHRAATIRLPGLFMSPGSLIMLLKVTYRMRPDQSHARSPLYRLMYLLRLKRLQLRQGRRSTNLHPRLLRRLEHWVLRVI